MCLAAASQSYTIDADCKPMVIRGDECGADESIKFRTCHGDWEKCVAESKPCTVLSHETGDILIDVISTVVHNMSYDAV
jgi:hypothetical protein